MTYENIYGLGYERATEPGPDVEFLNCDNEWLKPDSENFPICFGVLYRRPIKLQVGHRYVRRDGVVVKVLYYEPMNMPGFRFWCSDNKSRHENGAYTKKEQTSHDLVTHIEEPETKEEPMKDTVTVNNVMVISPLAVNLDVRLTHAQIEAAHAEMMRQKEANRITTGDIIFHKPTKSIRIIIGFDFNGIKTLCQLETFKLVEQHELEKVTGTPEFMAQLRAVLEGK